MMNTFKKENNFASVKCCLTCINALNPKNKRPIAQSLALLAYCKEMEKAKVPEKDRLVPIYFVCKCHDAGYGSN